MTEEVEERVEVILNHLDSSLNKWAERSLWIEENIPGKPVFKFEGVDGSLVLSHRDANKSFVTGSFSATILCAGAVIEQVLRIELTNQGGYSEDERLRTSEIVQKAFENELINDDIRGMVGRTLEYYRHNFAHYRAPASDDSLESVVQERTKKKGVMPSFNQVAKPQAEQTLQAMYNVVDGENIDCSYYIELGESSPFFDHSYST